MCGLESWSEVTHSETCCMALENIWKDKGMSVCEDTVDSGGNVSEIGSLCKTVYISIDFDTVSQAKVLELFL